MTTVFRGFFVRSLSSPPVSIPQPDWSANEAAFESLPSWMNR